MKYLLPYETLKNFITIELQNGVPAVSASYESFVTVVRHLIEAVEVDEAWYLDRYPDVAEAIKNGIIASARQHFVTDGYFEGRQPFAIRVNERWYLMQNTGVADYVRQGKLESAQQHFDEHGYREGRRPFGI